MEPCKYVLNNVTQRICISIPRLHYNIKELPVAASTATPMTGSIADSNARPMSPAHKNSKMYAEISEIKDIHQRSGRRTGAAIQLLAI